MAQLALAAQSAKGGVATLKNIKPPWPQHIVRGLFYGSQFTAAFFVMLIGMFFNAGMLIAIFLGQTVGYIAFGRDTLQLEETVDDGCCC
jgi:copper transporter 1